MKEEARMAVIATVSPNPTDTEHSITTLRTACMISGSDNECRELKEDVPMTVQMEREAQRQTAPVHWSHEEVKQWLRSTKKGAFASVAEKVAPSVDGRALVRMTEAMLVNVCGTRKHAESVYDAVRNEIARVDKFMSDRRKEARATATRAKSGQY